MHRVLRPSPSLFLRPPSPYCRPSLPSSRLPYPSCVELTGRQAPESIHALLTPVRGEQEEGAGQGGEEGEELRWGGGRSSVERDERGVKVDGEEGQGGASAWRKVQERMEPRCLPGRQSFPSLLPSPSSPSPPRSFPPQASEKEALSGFPPPRPRPPPSPPSSSGSDPLSLSRPGRSK